MQGFNSSTFHMKFERFFAGYSVLLPVSSRHGGARVHAELGYPSLGAIAT